MKTKLFLVLLCLSCFTFVYICVYIFLLPRSPDYVPYSQDPSGRGLEEGDGEVPALRSATRWRLGSVSLTLLMLLDDLLYLSK